VRLLLPALLLACGGPGSPAEAPAPPAGAAPAAPAAPAPPPLASPPPTLDLDGDQRADWLVAVEAGACPPGDAACLPGPAWLRYHGGPAGLAPHGPPLRFPGARALGDAGDIDADGRSDLALLREGPDGGLELAALCGAAAPAPTPGPAAALPAAVDARARVLPAGDVDGDGFGDLLAGRVLVFGGPACALGPALDLEPTGDARAAAPAPVGDLDADGHADLLLPSADPSLPIRWVRGGPARAALAAAPWAGADGAPLLAHPGARRGRFAAGQPAGLVLAFPTGDSACSPVELHTLRGGPGPVAGPTVVLAAHPPEACAAPAPASGPAPAFLAFPVFLAVGDLDGDGLDDAILPVARATEPAGEGPGRHPAALALARAPGGPAGLGAPDWPDVPAAIRAALPAVRVIGDTDGDGKAELLAVDRDGPRVLRFGLGPAGFTVLQTLAPPPGFDAPGARFAGATVGG